MQYTVVNDKSRIYIFCDHSQFFAETKIISDGVLVYSCGCTEILKIVAVSALTEK
jgi:hypothetical protein